MVEIFTVYGNNLSSQNSMQSFVCMNYKICVAQWTVMSVWRRSSRSKTHILLLFSDIFNTYAYDPTCMYVSEVGPPHWSLDPGPMVIFCKHVAIICKVIFRICKSFTTPQLPFKWKSPTSRILHFKNATELLKI